MLNDEQKSGDSIVDKSWDCPAGSEQSGVQCVPLHMQNKSWGQNHVVTYARLTWI